MNEGIEEIMADLPNGSLLFFIIPFAIIFSLIRVGRIPQLNLETTPTLVLDTLRDHISFQLETLLQLFYGEEFRLPEELGIETIGEHIYGGINDLTTLQEILLDLLNQGIQSPHFHQAIHLVIQHGV
jgi:hypothetical protein